MYRLACELQVGEGGEGKEEKWGGGEIGSAWVAPKKGLESRVDVGR